MLPMAFARFPRFWWSGNPKKPGKEKGLDYAVGRARFANNVRGQIVGDFAGLSELIFASQTGKLLGVQIIGENATELIHLGMMAVETGSTINVFIEFVFNYPTFSEMYSTPLYGMLWNASRSQGPRRLRFS